MRIAEGMAVGRRIPRIRITFVGASLLLILALVGASWGFVLHSDTAQTHSFFSTETLDRVWSFIKQLLGMGSSGTPAFAQWDEWGEAGSLAYKTLVMSVLGIGFAGTVALAVFMFGARNVMMGELAPYGSWSWRALFFLVRGLFIFTRGIPELFWAMLIIFVLSPGVLAGAVALGIHNAGILGKLSSEIVEGLDLRPLHALRSSGAGRFQVLAYGVLPQALPRLITYLLYRWEVIIRTTIVVGFVASGGLGMEFRLSMSYFHYTNVTLLLFWYMILVVAVDLMATLLRRLAR